MSSVLSACHSLHMRPKPSINFRQHHAQICQGIRPYKKNQSGVESDQHILQAVLCIKAYSIISTWIDWWLQMASHRSLQWHATYVIAPPNNLDIRVLHCPWEPLAICLSSVEITCVSTCTRWENEVHAMTRLSFWQILLSSLYAGARKLCSLPGTPRTEFSRNSGGHFTSLAKPANLP